MASKGSFPPSSSVTKWSNTLRRGSRWDILCCAVLMLYNFLFFSFSFINLTCKHLNISESFQVVPVTLPNTDRSMINCCLFRSCFLLLWQLCNTKLFLFPPPSAFRWAWQFTAVSWKSTLRNSASTSHAAPPIWWTRPMSGNFLKTATMTLTQSPKTKNRRRSSKRNNSEHVSIMTGLINVVYIEIAIKWYTALLLWNFSL